MNTNEAHEKKDMLTLRMASGWDEVKEGMYSVVPESRLIQDSSAKVLV